MAVYEHGSLGSPTHPSGARPRGSPATPLVPQGRAGSHGSGPRTWPLRTTPDPPAVGTPHRRAWLHGARRGASGAARSRQSSKSVPLSESKAKGREQMSPYLRPAALSLRNRGAKGVRVGPAGHPKVPEGWYTRLRVSEDFHVRQHHPWRPRLSLATVCPKPPCGIATRRRSGGRGPGSGRTTSPL